MRVISFNEKEGRMKLMPENVEDLWHLQKIINAGDRVIGHTERRYRPPGAKKEAGEKKKVTIDLEAEKIEFHKHANVLRVTGKIKAGTPEEYIQVGSYHTIDVYPRFVFVLKKEKWTTYEMERLKEAQKSAKRPIVRIVVLDNKIANVATLRGYGIDFEFEIKSRTSKRDEKYEEKMKKYFSEIEKAIKESKKTIIAGPGFTGEAFKKYLENKRSPLLKSIMFAHASTAERSGVYELLKSGVISKFMKEEKISREYSKIESFLAELQKETGLAVYGMEEVKEAISYGALKELLVLDEFVRKDPTILEEAKKMKVEVMIFTSEEEPWKKLKRFGGIAGILRFKIK